LFSVFIVAPAVATVWWSLYTWDGVSLGKWVGLDNYVGLVSDPRLAGTFLNALALAFFYSVLPLTIGLLLASALSARGFRFRGAFRTILFLPQVITPVVTAVIWIWIYSPTNGLLNQTLGVLGLDGLQRTWLGDFDLALPAVGMVATWVTYGFPMVLFIAGIQKIPLDLYEAARIDGAGAFAEFRAVTLPGLRFELAVALVLTAITAFRSFDIVYNMTRGGPGRSTTVPAVELFRRAFETGQVGSAAALGVGLAVLIFVLAGGLLRITERLRT
jgi:raffinose/stachyose/melibiose transport system permease protein